MKKNIINDYDFEKKIKNNEYFQKENDFNEAIKTKFWISFLFLIIECIIPILVLWLLTGNDFHFSYKINHILVWIFSIIELFISFLFTLLFYIFHFHKTDQFTYMFSVQFTLLSMYISGFYLKYHISYRILISLGFLLIGILIGAICSSIFYNFKLKNK